VSGLSQPTHFSFAAEIGGWSFLSLPWNRVRLGPEEKQQGMGLHHGHSVQPT